MEILFIFSILGSLFKAFISSTLKLDPSLVPVFNLELLWEDKKFLKLEFKVKLEAKLLDFRLLTSESWDELYYYFRFNFRFTWAWSTFHYIGVSEELILSVKLLLLERKDLIKCLFESRFYEEVKLSLKLSTKDEETSIWFVFFFPSHFLDFIIIIFTFWLIIEFIY